MEIGSVLELDNLDKYNPNTNNKEFVLPFMGDNKFNTLFYQSGRNAIEVLFSFLKETMRNCKVLLPDYMCGTVGDAVKRAQADIINYRIDKDFGTNIEDIENNIDEVSVIYIAHFFGLPPARELLDKIEDWKKRGKIIVEDVTLSLFSEGAGQIGFGDYIIGSLRKWLPIPDGGFISSLNSKLPDSVSDNRISRYTSLYFGVQFMKREYINGGCQNSELKEIYMKYYSESVDELFSDYAIYPMSSWSRSYINNVDLAAVRKDRISNFDYLTKLLESIPRVEIVNRRSEGFLPFGVVLNVDNRDEFLQYLISNRIYCNVHWRLGENKENDHVKYLSDRLITVPCDQRYGCEDMERMAQVIRKWFEDNK